MKEMPETAHAMGRVLPEDRYNEELVANVHPPDWKNPEPGNATTWWSWRRHRGAVTAAGAAGLGARVALVERHLLGATASMSVASRRNA
jgi:hypothetical protein